MSLIILIGLPCSTKSSYAHQLNKDNKYIKSIILSRDILSQDTKLKIKTTHDMIPLIKKYYDDNYTVIIDNLNLNLEILEEYKTITENILYIYFNTNITDCQIRYLTRQYKKYNTINMEGIDKTLNDSNMFPITVLFKYNKLLEKNIDIILNSISKTNIKIFDIPHPIFNYKNKGLFLDIDETLRKTDHLEFKYPTHPSEVIIKYENTRKILNKYINEGYILIGISNQSGVSKGIISLEIMNKCMVKTKELLGIDFEIFACTHNSFPIKCYCRKPQVGNVVLACEKYKIDPKKSIFIGDRTTDETCAHKMKMKFIYAKDFFLINLI